MRDQDSIEETIISAIDAFNGYRNPWAKARLARRSNDAFWVEFSGCFCGTCSFYDYFEDLRHELEEGGLPVALERVSEKENCLTVEFRVD
ncbi:MAG TPA: hypothetical protein VE134_09145, partial [Methanomicrobiales archaeon]|nr:hypothetical protein [Methanomicrobiales archaeon]